MSELIDIIKIGIFVYVFTELMDDGMILNWYAKLIDRIKYDWIYKPLGGCNKCMAGQVALYFYLIKYFHSYDFFEHVFFISATILTTLLIDKIMDYGITNH